MEVAMGRKEERNGEEDFKGAKQWRIQLSSQQRAPLVYPIVTQVRKRRRKRRNLLGGGGGDGDW